MICNKKQVTDWVLTLKNPETNKKWFTSFYQASNKHTNNNVHKTHSYVVLRGVRLIRIRILKYSKNIWGVSKVQGFESSSKFPLYSMLMWMPIHNCM